MEPVTFEQVEQWAAKGFQGLEKPQLRAACRLHEIEAAPATGIEGLRLKLLQKFGMETGMPTSRELAPVNIRVPPNLRRLKGWAGLKYRIRALPLDKENANKPYVVVWEGQAFWLKPKEKFQDVPAPIYNIIQDAIGMEIKPTWNQTTMTVDKETIDIPRIPHVFIGITPGTEGKPAELIDWYRRDCEDHDFYADVQREELGQIWGVLTDQSHPNEKEHEWSTDRWRRAVLWLLQLTPEQIYQKENPMPEESDEEEEVEA